MPDAAPLLIPLVAVVLAPALRLEWLLVGAFVAGTHGYAGAAAPWAGALYAVAILASYLWRRRIPQATGADRSSPQVLAMAAGALLLAWLALSCAWSPAPVALSKWLDIAARVGVPVGVALSAASSGLLDGALMLRVVTRLGSAIAALALLLSLGSYDQGARLTIPGLHPLALAQMCAVVAVLAICRGEIGLSRVEACASAAVTGLCLVLTASKGPLTAAAVAAVVIIAHRWLSVRERPSVRKLVTAGAAGLVIILGLAAAFDYDVGAAVPDRLTPGFYFGPGAEQRTESISSRQQLWVEAWSSFVDSPATGQGLGASALSEVRGRFSSGQLTDYPHNMLLELAAESGVLGVALAGLLLASLARAGRSSAGALGLLAVMVSIAMVTGGLADHRVLVLVAGATSLSVPAIKAVRAAPPVPSRSDALSSSRRG